MRLRYKLPLAFALTTLVFAGIVALVSGIVLHDVYLDRLEEDMGLQAKQFAAVLQQEAIAGIGGEAPYLQSLTNAAGDAGSLRLTLIAHDGTVLGDSVADPASMENHATRPEVAQALKGREGQARRYSATLNQEEVYVTVPLPDSNALWSSGVVRTALPASRVDALVSAAWRVPLIVWAVLLVPILAISYLLTRTITKPLRRLQAMTARVASGDLSYRTSIRRKDELGDLATSLNGMASRLESQVNQLTTEEERSAQVLRAMTEGVIVVDEDGRILRANPAAGRILQADLENSLGVSLVVLARAFPDKELAEQAHQAGAAVADIVELPGRRFLAVEVIPLHASEGAAGRPGQTLYVIRDETARLALERVRRDFATNVSHELKTPLASLSLLAATLKHAMREDPEQAALFVDRLSAEVGRLTDLAGDLLTLSQFEEMGSQVESEFAPTDVGRLAQETAAELRPLAEARNQEMIVDAAPGALVLGDDVALRTLLRNLLDNAIRYTEPEGHIAVRVRRETDAGGRPWVVLAVQDDGVGIPAAEQKRIFERFYRVDKARSRETGGTGLGLSIVRHVAERHGGSVDVQSTLGSGSTFTVRLPCTQ
jgi:two-component system phosphate regulon sensor histidine kinase PhoR